MKSRAVVVFALLTLLVNPALAQGRPELDALDEKIKRNFEKSLPGWKHERVDPIVKSGEGIDRVLVFWKQKGQSIDCSTRLRRRGA